MWIRLLEILDPREALMEARLKKESGT